MSKAEPPEQTFQDIFDGLSRELARLVEDRKRAVLYNRDAYASSSGLGYQYQACLSG